MSINIRANIGTSMRYLSEQGTFRNSMYQQEHENEKKEKQKQKPTVHPTVIKDQVTSNFKIDEDLRLKSTSLQSEISHLEEDMSIVQTVACAL